MGELSLRRRTQPSTGVDVWEVNLGDEFLMSSLFTEGEIALAELALAGNDLGELDVVVGGLGLGYTARAVLGHRNVRSLIVVEAIPEILEWHRRGLVPLGTELSSDARCRLVHGDFFSLARPGAGGFDPLAPARKFHAVLVDIDHSPRSLLHASHASFYELEGLRGVASHLHPGGVFALWSNEPPDDAFLASLRRVFAASEARVVKFFNPLQTRDAANTVYLART